MLCFQNKHDLLTFALHGLVTGDNVAFPSTVPKVCQLPGCFIAGAQDVAPVDVLVDNLLAVCMNQS